jgi:hypothetical protein
MHISLDLTLILDQLISGIEDEAEAATITEVPAWVGLHRLAAWNMKGLRCAAVLITNSMITRDALQRLLPSGLIQCLILKVYFKFDTWCATFLVQLPFHNTNDLQASGFPRRSLYCFHDDTYHAKGYKTCYPFLDTSWILAQMKLCATPPRKDFRMDKLFLMTAEVLETCSNKSS